MIGAHPPRVTPERVREIMDRPPVWLAGSYLPAWRSGRFSTRGLACGVVAALGRSSYSDDDVDEVMSILVSLGYTEEPISAAILV